MHFLFLQGCIRGMYGSTRSRKLLEFGQAPGGNIRRGQQQQLQQGNKQRLRCRQQPLQKYGDHNNDDEVRNIRVLVRHPRRQKEPQKGNTQNLKRNNRKHFLACLTTHDRVRLAAAAESLPRTRRAPGIQPP